ncbi:MAG: hydroxymethylbilane synthase, partial [Beijerinckiaceae bacterium]
LLRGNVETRLARVAAGDFDATLLAVAGLRRLKLADRVTAVLPVDDFLPAVGQGAIAIAARTGDSRIAAILAPILDPETTVALTCERAFLARLDGSCRTPIGGLAEVDEGRIVFRGEVLSPEGRTVGTVRRAGPLADAASIGDDAAMAILGGAGAPGAINDGKASL